MSSTSTSTLGTWNSGDSPWNSPPTEMTPRGQLCLIQGVKKARTTTSRDLQASLASVKISVHASTIRERETGQKWPLWESSKAKTTADKQNIKARICHKTSLIPRDFWKCILIGADKTKFEHFGRCLSCYIWHKYNTTLAKKKIIATVRCGGGVMVWGCFAVIDGTVH